MSASDHITLRDNPFTTRKRSMSFGHARHPSNASSVGTTDMDSADSSRALGSNTSSTSLSSTNSDNSSRRACLSHLPWLPWAFKTILPQNCKGNRLITTNNVIWVRDIWQLDIFLEMLPAMIDPNCASMFCDQEGNKMDRNGTLSLLQISFAALDITFIFDVTVLGSIVFERRVFCGQSLRQVLEDPMVVKVYFDVRNDSDAIFAHFGIHLRGIIDLQLMELACRGIRCEPTGLQSLAKCIELHLGPGLATDEYLEWCQAKAAGRKYCDKHGWAGYDERPLPEVLAKYAAQDTIYMPHLYAVYLWKLQECPMLMALIIRASQKRADDSLHANYQSGGPGKGLGPESFLVVDGDDDGLFEEIEASHFTSRDLMPPNQGW